MPCTYVEIRLPRRGRHFVQNTYTLLLCYGQYRFNEIVWSKLLILR